MSGWYYIRKGMLDDTQEGPFADAACLQLAFDGSIKPKTMVCHSTHTKGQWLQADLIPTLKRKCEDGDASRAQIMTEKADEKRRQKEERQLQKEVERQAKQELKLRQAEPPPTPAIRHGEVLSASVPYQATSPVPNGQTPMQPTMVVVNVAGPVNQAPRGSGFFGGVSHGAGFGCGYLLFSMFTSVFRVIAIFAFIIAAVVGIIWWNM